MSRYLNACIGEWKKIFTTKAWWILGLVLVLYVAFAAALVALIIYLALDPESQEMAQNLDMSRMIYAFGPSLGYLFPVLIGALSVTGEYRHHTLGSTFVWNGSRGAVLGAKTTTQLIMGFIYGVAALIAAVLASIFFLMAAGMNTGLGDTATWMMFLRAILAMGLWAVVGVGIGILVQNQAAAIVVVIVFTQFIEPIARTVGAFNDTAAKIVAFLPGAASDSFTGSSFYSAISGASSGYDGLSWWAGGLVLAGYALVLLLLAWATRWRADVD